MYDHAGVLPTQSSRHYLTAFRRDHVTESRLEPDDQSGRGPGAYTIRRVGVRILDPIRPSAILAPRVGGKFAHVLNGDRFA